MKYFFVGIKGVGVVGIATLYKEWGHDVSGSDTTEVFFTDEILRSLQIPVVSFDSAAITPDIDTVIYSSAYGERHPQIMRAQALGIRTLSYSEALSSIFNGHKGLVVTGTHGKTTSAAMLGRVLEDAGYDPTVVVGGELVEWGRTVRAGKSEWMVVEGDEYQEKILALRPYAVLLTNIEYDHPDFYPDEEAYRGAFRRLLRNVPKEGIVVAHESLRAFVDAETEARKIFFADAGRSSSFSLTVWGAHNYTNAAGVLLLAEALGIPRERAHKTLSAFRGTRRRMELYTAADADIVIVDDYAHHPTEIRATLRALRDQYPDRRIIAFFQPHTYSRTKAFMDEFASSFADADTAGILDVYGSARETGSGDMGRRLFEATQAHHPGAVFVPTLADALAYAETSAVPGSVIVSLGAGDVWHIARDLAAALEEGH